MAPRAALEEIAEIITAWRTDDSPEGIMPEEWVLEQIQAVLKEAEKEDE